MLDLFNFKVTYIREDDICPFCGGKLHCKEYHPCIEIKWIMFVLKNICVPVVERIILLICLILLIQIQLYA